MSFDSGPGAYAPPPPKRGLSPWAWVGIGCASVTLLGVGGCVILGFQFARAFNNATSPEESRDKLKAANIPIYPGAQINAAATRAAGGVMNIMGGMMGKGTSISMVAFECPDPATKVHSWYVQQTSALGFAEQTRGDRGNPAGRNVSQHMYVKGDDMIMVQTQDPESGKQGCVLVLAHFKGLNKKNAR